MQNAISLAAGSNAIASRAALTSAFSVLDYVIEARNAVPILGNARLTGDGKSLFLTGTNTDAEIVVRIAAAADAGFDITIPAKSFKTLLKGAPKADYVAITAGDEFATADFESVAYKLQTLPVVDFPEMAGPGASACAFALPGLTLRNALAKVSGAMSSEETRYYLRGIFMTQDGDEFRMVATDGHRLYCQSMAIPEGLNLPENGGWQRGVILPAETVDILSKLLKGKTSPESVEISISKSKARFTFPLEFGHVTITSKLVDGTFPDYQRVIPSSPSFRAEFHADTLAEKVKACSLISSERSRAFKLSIAPGGAAIDVNNPDTGSAHAAMPCAWDGEEFQIGFNARYILEALALVEGETVHFGLSHPDSPALITGGDNGWKAVLMPMRT